MFFIAAYARIHWAKGRFHLKKSTFLLVSTSGAKQLKPKRKKIFRALSIQGKLTHQQSRKDLSSDPNRSPTMQYMMLFHEPATEFDKRNDPAAAPAYWGAWNAYIGALGQAGVVVNGAGLQPPQMSTTVRLRGGKRQVQDGPYADSKDHLGGYFIIEVPSLDAALEWAARSPNASVGGTEVRPVLPPPAA